MGGIVLHAPAAQATVTPATAAPATTTLVTPVTTTLATTTTVKTAPAVQAGAASTAAATRQAKAARQRLKAAKAVATAKKQIGDPYRFGGTGPGAFDCSGLVQYSWAKAGIKIPRVTYSQYARIKKKVRWSDLKPGDLMFFRGKGHVGMYVGKGRMVHSPSTGKTVRIEKLGGWRKASFAGAVRPGA
ncbi:C40 family peptidase [Nonomuraea sp. NPDC003727]